MAKQPHIVIFDPDAVFCEGGRLHGEVHCMELESAQYQDPSGLYWPRLRLQRGEGPEHTKAVMCRTTRIGATEKTR